MEERLGGDRAAGGVACEEDLSEVGCDGCWRGRGRCDEICERGEDLGGGLRPFGVGEDVVVGDDGYEAAWWDDVSIGC